MQSIETEIVEITIKDTKELLTKIKKNSVYEDNGSVSKNNLINAIELLQEILNRANILNGSVSSMSNFPKCLNNGALVEHFDFTKCVTNSIVENQLVSSLAKDPNTKKIINRISNLQCLFTWNIKPNGKKNKIVWIWNKYGEYNLNISSTEFTLERFIGNLIISYEFFHKGDSELAQLKILEIGKWLEELDKGTDKFYLSIKTGLRHIIEATFIHMLFATNLIEECTWFLKDICSFACVDSKSRASIHAIRAAVLIEYGENLGYVSKACGLSKKACAFDPNTSYWFYIHSLALTALRQLLLYNSLPANDEIKAINQAIVLSNEQNPLFNYHKLFIDYTYYISKKNLGRNQKVADMIKIIMQVVPKDPHLVVNYTKIIMTLPTMVGDANLGLKYLKTAFQTSQNDVTVLKAIGKTIEAYYNEFQKTNPKVTELLNLDFEFKNIVEKQKEGEDPVPYLSNMVLKYNGFNQSKIISQLCSYKLLFTNHLHYAIEEYKKLIEQPEIVNNEIIVQHISIFGSKKFNLSELIYNEIKLAANGSPTSSELSHYMKMLSKIIETCNLENRDVDSSMKANLIVNSPASLKCKNKSFEIYY
ncbi:hypothetical protein ACI65C_006775 [Semiaphis heraclei]